MGKTAAELRGLRLWQRPGHRPAGDAGGRSTGSPAAADDEARAPAFERTTPRLVEPDTRRQSAARCSSSNNWTDGLPIVLPTEERVAEMLAHTSRKPDEVVGRMQPTEFRVAWEYTVEKVAVNAVMAGARPEYFPVILALAASQVSARGSTSSSASAMVVVNGPIRHEIGMNCRHRRDGSLQSRQCHHRPGLWSAVAEPAGRLGAGRDLHGLAGQQLHLQQHHLCRERGAQPLGAAARAEGLQGRRQHRERLLRLPLDHLLPGLARELLARARARHAARGSTATRRRACCSIRSRRGSSSIAAASTPRTS